MEFIGVDLPRPNLAEEDNYDGGGVKISTADTRTTAMRLRQ